MFTVVYQRTHGAPRIEVNRSEVIGRLVVVSRLIVLGDPDLFSTEPQATRGDHFWNVRLPDLPLEYEEAGSYSALEAKLAQFIARDNGSQQGEMLARDVVSKLMANDPVREQRPGHGPYL